MTRRLLAAPLPRHLCALAALFAITTALLAFGAPARASAAAPSTSGSGCGQTEGVTVVVDFTDLDGTIEVGCAEGDPASGRDALEAAGFTPKDSTPGMICAIDSRPNPCPEEFTGSFWSYWQGEDGEWISSPVGADEADPAPGDVEGWRYFDGSAGPGIAPAAAVATTGDSGERSAASSSEQSQSSEQAAEASDEAAEKADQADFDPAGLIIAGAVALVLIIGIVLVLRRRRAMREH